MAKKILIPLLQPLLWCFLLSVTMASVEAHGHFASKGVNLSLPFEEFHGKFANTAAVWFIGSALCWCLLSFFMVWLGGVRKGLALFFMLAFLALLGYLAVVLDVLLTHSDKFSAQWADILRIFALLSLGLATLASLILSKLFRRYRPIQLRAKGFIAFALIIMAAAFATWARHAGLPQVQINHFWWIFAVLSICVAALICWLGRHKALLAGILVALAVSALAPLRSGFYKPHESAPALLPAEVPPHAVRHVILVTVDTLRRDALGTYNGNPASSPELDQLAAESTVFENAFSTAPWTYPSIASWQTGLSPEVHQLWDERRVLSDKIGTLAELLRHAGYRTAAFGFNGMLLPRSGLYRGFDEYRWFPEEHIDLPNFATGFTHTFLAAFGNWKPDAEAQTDLVLPWLKAHEKEDYFLWLHYFSPHMPYAPPAEFQPTDETLRALGTEYTDVRGGRMGSQLRSAEGRAWARALYEGEVRFADHHIGRIFDLLKSQGIYDNAIIAFTSDHGEELWDHDRFEHGHTLYNELVRVPFFLKQPGQHDARRSAVAVSTRALMPTLLDLCSLPRPAGEAFLAPLSPLMGNQAGVYVAQPVRIGATLFQDRLEGVAFDGMKYMRGGLSGHEQLFNLLVDPEERTNIAAQDAANLERGRQLLQAAQAAETAQREQLGLPLAEGAEINQDAVRSMEALGYL